MQKCAHQGALHTWWSIKPWLLKDLYDQAEWLVGCKTSMLAGRVPLPPGRPLAGFGAK